jgi:hypothetical protein
VDTVKPKTRKKKPMYHLSMSNKHNNKEPHKRNKREGGNMDRKRRKRRKRKNIWTCGKVLLDKL